MPKYLKEKPFDQNEKPFDQNEKPFDLNEKPFDMNEKPFDQNEKLKYLKENSFSTLEKACSPVLDPSVFTDLDLKIKFLRFVFVVVYTMMVQSVWKVLFY